MKSSVPLHTLLSAASGDLARTLRRVRQLQRADQALQPQLGTVLTGHCHVANIRGTTLVLQVDSAAWGTRLRYQLPSLQRQLKASRTFSAIHDIEVTIRPRGNADRRSAPDRVPRRARLSSQAAALIATVANTTADPALQATLRRLASRSRDD